MDVGVFLRHVDRCAMRYKNQIPRLEHVCAVYKKDELQMQSLLNSLKGKGLLQDADLSLGRISMHDLYHECVVLEAKGKLVEATSIGNRRWVYVDVRDGDLSKLEDTPAGGCWQNLTRLSVRQDDDQPIAHSIKSLAGIEWQYFPNVLVLQLCGLNTVKGTLNLKGMKCLQSLQIHGLLLIERLEGLEGLTNLTHFEWSSTSVLGPSRLEAIVGRFPRSLKYVEIRVNRVV